MAAVPAESVLASLFQEGWKLSSVFERTGWKLSSVFERTGLEVEFSV